MKIVRSHTGAAIAAVPEHGVIFIDPSMGHNTAVGAIRAVLPNAHPDAVKHWVEKVIPSAPPLVGHYHSGRHRRQLRVDRLGRGATRVSSMAAAMALGAIGTMALAAPKPPATPAPSVIVEKPADGVVPFLDNHAKPAPSKTPGASLAPAMTPVAIWSDQEIKELRRIAEWKCGEGQLVTKCNVGGLDVEVTAQIGLTSARYAFDYTDKRGRHQYGVFFLFKTEGERRRFQDATAGLRRDNMFAGPRWLLYGTDGYGLRTWAQKLKTGAPSRKAASGSPGTASSPSWWAWWE